MNNDLNSDNAALSAEEVAIRDDAYIRGLEAQVEQLRLRNQELTQQRNEASRHADEGWFKAGEADTARMQAEARNQTMREALSQAPTPEWSEHMGQLSYRVWYDGTRRVALSEPAEPKGEQAE